MKSLLKTLTETFSPSGYEDEIRKVITKEVKPLADEIRVDALGNLIVRKKPAKGAKDPKKIMIAAHMDEIGVMVTHVDSNGFVRFTGIGGVYPRNLPGGHVRFANGVSGVIGLEPTNSASDVPPLAKMFIDVGASSKKNCPVKTGDVAGFERSFLDLGNKLVANSINNRSGVAILIKTLYAIEQIPNDLYFVFTTQNEVGAHGGGAAAYSIAPNFGIVVDVTPTGDTPNSSKSPIELGKGPCIKFLDRRTVADPRVINWIIQTAKKLHLPYQREVSHVDHTDTGEIQISQAGVMTGILSIPMRYIHTGSEMVCLDDLITSVKLLAKMLDHPTSI